MHLGTVRLQALDTATVEAMLATLALQGKSPKTARNVHGCLSKALNDARRWRLVSQNAATGAQLPNVPKRPPRYCGLPNSWVTSSHTLSATVSPPFGGFMQ